MPAFTNWLFANPNKGGLEMGVLLMERAMLRVIVVLFGVLFLLFPPISINSQSIIDICIVENSGEYKIYTKQPIYWLSYRMGGEPLNWLDTRLEEWRGSPCLDGTRQSTLLIHGGGQTEYAYRVDIAGGIDDIGGVVHGNEFANGDVSIKSNDLQVEVYQELKSIVEGITVTMSVLTHTIDSAGILIEHVETWQTEAEVGWAYPAMIPILTYDGLQRKEVFSHVVLGDKEYYLPNYFGDDSAWSETDSVYKMTAFSEAMPLILNVEITPESVNNFENACFWFSAWRLGVGPGPDLSPISHAFAKGYFERSCQSEAVTVIAGDIWNAKARYDFEVGFETFIPLVYK